MKFAKYNGESKTTIKYVGNTAGSGGSGSGSLSRSLWGNEDTGGNISENIFVNGSIYLSDAVDEDLEDDDDNEGKEKTENSYETRSEDFGGNIYMESGCLFAGSVNYDFSGTKTDLATHQKKQDDDISNHETRIKYIESLMPVGTILMYAGNIAIPAGWHICDGTGGTIDLRKKFIRGANSVSEAGNTGGAESVTLGVANLPAHNHTATTTINLEKSTTLNPAFDNVKDQIISTQKETYYQVFDMGGDKHYTLESGYEDPTDKGVIELTVGDIVGYVSDINYTATATTTIGNTGSGNSFNILPPYYDVIYIQRVS